MTSLLDRFKSLLARQALPLLSQDKQPLLNPLAIPVIIGHAPPDFAHYKFDGATLVTIKRKNAVGQILRRRGLVACMVLKDQSSEGASARIEMLVSLADLKNGHHPQYRKVEKILMDIHNTKIHQPIASAPQNLVTRATVLQKDFVQASREKLSFLLDAH